MQRSSNWSQRSSWLVKGKGLVEWERHSLFCSVGRLAFVCLPLEGLNLWPPSGESRHDVLLAGARFLELQRCPILLFLLLFGAYQQETIIWCILIGFYLANFSRMFCSVGHKNSDCFHSPLVGEKSLKCKLIGLQLSTRGETIWSKSMKQVSATVKINWRAYATFLCLLVKC